MGDWGGNTPFPFLHPSLLPALLRPEPNFFAAHVGLRPIF